MEELAAIVREASGGPDYHGTPLALGALSGEPAADFGLLVAMEYLCRQCAIEVEPVSGSTGLWLIVATPEGYRHLLPDSMYALEEPIPFRLYTDGELLKLGHQWNTEFYPPCTEAGVEALMNEGLEAGPI